MAESDGRSGGEAREVKNKDDGVPQRGKCRPREWKIYIYIYRQRAVYKRLEDSSKRHIVKFIDLSQYAKRKMTNLGKKV